MDTCAQAEEYSSDWEAHSAFCFLVLSHRTISLDTVEKDFQRVAQKSFLCWTLCTTPGNKLRGGLGKAADIKSTVTFISSVLKKPGCTHCLLTVRKKSWGEDREGIFQFPEETTSPCPSPSCNGTPPRKSKGMHSPRRCASSKIQGFAQLSRLAFNHVLWWERHF